MSERAYLRPGEVARASIETGAAKASAPVPKLVLLSILAGAFISLASAGANVAAHTIESAGAAKLVAGTLFPAGLMLVLLGGGELFTGNCLIVLSCLGGKARWSGFLRNMAVVYLGNLLGSLLVTALVQGSGQLNLSAGALGGYAIKVAAHKVNLSFSEALCSGILCNILVCMAVWLSYAAKDVAGKVLCIFFPIFLFVLSGFEHCVANMYYIPAGLMALGNPAYLERARAVYGVGGAALQNLNVPGFLLKNLLPVTLGNLIGGALLVGCAYYLAYVWEKRDLAEKASARRVPHV